MTFKYWNIIENSAVKNLCGTLPPLMRYVVVVARPLPRDGGMAEYYGAPEAGQTPRGMNQRL